jgi:hypothetical protein
MSMCRAPASTVMVSASILRMRFIFIRRRVPPSATAQGAAEWLEPAARTGAGYFVASFMTATMSSTEFASTMTLGCETRSPNQLVTSRSAILPLQPVLRTPPGSVTEVNSTLRTSSIRRVGIRRVTIRSKAAAGRQSAERRQCGLGALEAPLHSRHATEPYGGSPARREGG